MPKYKLKIGIRGKLRWWRKGTKVIAIDCDENGKCLIERVNWISKLEIQNQISGVPLIHLEKI